jgi:flagellar protein FliS
MIKNTSNVLNVYKKVEKAGDVIKSPYEIIKIILNELQRNIHLMILEIDKKKAFTISRKFKEVKSSQNAISKYLVRSLTTIYSLQTSLDFEKGGTIATNLFQLYEFCRIQVIDSFSSNNNSGLKKSYDALSQIIQAWETMEVQK